MPQTTANALVQVSDLDIGGRIVRFELGSERKEKTFGGDRPKSAPSASLIVKSLSWNVDDNLLGGHFDGCTSARVIMDRDTGSSKG
jgi:hypothetical protein